MPFGDLLQFIHANMSTGTLQIRKKDVLKMIYFEKGRIVSSSSSDPKEYLGHFLVSMGFINEEELAIAMEVQRTSKILLGKILVISGKVKEQDMSRLLKLKAEETVYSLFLWDEGEFTFHQDQFSSSMYVRIQIDAQSLIFEGVLRRDEWQRIRDVFPHNNVILEVVPGSADAEGSSQEKIVFGLVDGKRTIDDIQLAAHTTEYGVCRSLFNLHDKGRIRIRKILDHAPTQAGLGGVHTARQLQEQAADRLQKKRYGEALDLLRQIDPNASGYHEKVVPLLDQAEREATQNIYAKHLSPDSILKLKIPLMNIPSDITPEEGFLLSRIDGTWDVRSILSVTPLKEVDALRLLKKLLDRGLIECA